MASGLSRVGFRTVRQWGAADEYDGLVWLTRPRTCGENADRPGSSTGTDGGGSLLIDREAVQKSAAASVRAEVTYTVQMAKAETLVQLGRNHEGCDIAVRAYRQRFPKPQ